MVRKPLMLSFDPEVKLALEDYVKSLSEQTKRHETMSGVMQELAIAKLKKAGFWPPKKK